MDLKNGCALMSLAPAFEPSLFDSSLCNSLRMSDLQLLETCVLYGAGCSRNWTSQWSTREKVSLRPVPLNGVVPN